MTEDTVQEATHADVMAALAEWGAEIAATRDQVAALREEFHAFMAGPQADDGMVPFDDVALGDFVKIGDIWPQVLGKTVEHTLEGEAREILILRDELDLPSYRYEVPDGDRFLVSGPF